MTWTGPEPNQLTSERDQRTVYDANLAAAREHVAEAWTPPKPGPMTEAQRAACEAFSASRDFETLGKWLARLEHEFREWREGTEEEKLTCTVRYSPETYVVAKTLQLVMEKFKGLAFKEADLCAKQREVWDECDD